MIGAKPTANAKVPAAHRRETLVVSIVDPPRMIVSACIPACPSDIALSRERLREVLQFGKLSNGLGEPPGVVERGTIEQPPDISGWHNGTFCRPADDRHVEHHRCGT